MILKLIIIYFGINFMIWYIMLCAYKWQSKEFPAKMKKLIVFFGLPLLVYEVVTSLKKKNPG